MADPLSTNEAQIIGLLLQSVFYGVYLVSFFVCIQCLIWDSGRFKSLRSLHWPMLTVALILCILSTLDLVLGFLRSIQAFILCTQPGSTVKGFANSSDWVNVVKSSGIVVTVVLGDAILVYRCWIVYGKSFAVVVVPSLLWAADAACGGVVLWIQATIEGHSIVNVGKLKPFLTSFTALTIVQNMITTSLIVYRIWRVDRESSQFRHNNAFADSSVPRRSKLQNVMRIVIESGLLYTTFAFVSFCTNVTASNSFYIATDVEVPFTGIAFNLIIIRANNKAMDEYTIPPTGHSIVFNSMKTTTAARSTVLGRSEEKTSAQAFRMSKTGLDSDSKLRAKNTKQGSSVGDLSV